MSDTRNLLDRISAFRQRLDSTPNLVPEALPVDGTGSVVPVVSEVESFRFTLRRIPGAAGEGAATQYTDRAQRLLTRAKGLLDRQRTFTNDPLVAACAADETDPLVCYHRETVGILDSVVRLAQGMPDSAGGQLKLCDGLNGLLGVVQDRLAVQEQLLARRRRDEDRIDKLASFFTALHCNLPVAMEPVAALAEELLEEARQGRSIRYLSAPVMSASAPGGAQAYAVPARYVAAHALNVAQVVARLVPFDYEWAGRPLAPVVGALVMDCGMLKIPAAVLAKTEPLTADERRAIEAHPRLGAELLLWRFPNLAGPLAAAVATHHERTDGTGYPAGVAGAQIPALGRLLRVADVYAALNEERPHRPAADPRAALTDVLLLAEQSQVDRDFAEYLLHLSFYPVNTVIELTDGRVGVVVANHANRMDPRAPGRPVVAVLTDADGAILPRAEHLDLSASDRGSIVKAVPLARRRELLGSRYPDLV
ncbi:HD domain-containing protein [Gemmata sp. JC673]|uniref:HD domain-containing protein n=1 Tax=Gemmata algarum TaxID=2975278 RepID=A0ABU5F469_9BACT|nr:HD domain-containing phosphohydrolase [Gemmata algarum]MDY3561994.1 HD domain-containing protein [Gemmata algarum]